MDATNDSLADPGAGNGAAVGDIDADGDLDLHVVNYQQPNKLFLNDGHGGFTAGDAGVEDPGSGMAAGMADYDRDGDLDLYVVNGAVGESNLLYANQTDGIHHWLQVDLIGTQSNRFGVGARIVVSTEQSSQVREITAGTGSMAQSAITAMFGLADQTEVLSLEVHWPGGSVQTLTDVTVDQYLLVDESGADVGEQEPLPGRDGQLLLGRG